MDTEYRRRLNVQRIPVVDWQGRTVYNQNYALLAALVKYYDCKCILEFGSGLSTVFLVTLGIPIVSYEVLANWKRNVLEKIRKEYPAYEKNLEIRMWDGKHFKDKPQHYDLAFVDGPGGGKGRRAPIIIASKFADIVCCHDYHGVPTVKPHIERFLDTPDFISKGPISGLSLHIRREFYERKNNS